MDEHVSTLVRACCRSAERRLPRYCYPPRPPCRPMGSPAAAADAPLAPDAWLLGCCDAMFIPGGANGLCWLLKGEGEEEVGGC